ncbi:FHA domain-containing protein [Rhodocaloribacter litoris]|uniref:FHA domain-containing protein n=1 Tax=Rhodocaloribacter litoris TaxID=2558931 RepID=UPI001423D409|nr:FHA domain-containing protein [Rhodocaloribacter litoris]QXD13863.1 FHA domain-containing protein [Rhodocaloribacter litoris]
MPFRVLVRRTDEPSAGPDAYVFHQERVVVGRDRASDLHLADPKRIVSKQHAEIASSGATFTVRDLGSKNFTYLNGERLQSERPYEVQPGDVIRIGDFELSLETVVAPAGEPAPPPDYDRTVFDVSFVNPFREDARLLAATLRSIGKTYAETDAVRRDEALVEALREVLAEDGAQPAHAVIARALGREAAAPSVPAPPVRAAEPVETSPARPAVSLPPAEGPRLLQLLDVLLRVVSRFIGAPWQFRYEFIGQTILQPEETAFLYEGDPELLKRQVLDPSVPEEVARQRMQLLEEAAEDVSVHQIALLDGYKAAVQEGAQRLLDPIDPAQIEAEVRQEQALYRLLPPLAKAEVLRRLQAQLQQLRAEDWSATERRTYRPAFIKAYLARMTSRRRARDPERR